MREFDMDELLGQVMERRQPSNAVKRRVLEEILEDAEPMDASACTAYVARIFKRAFSALDELGHADNRIHRAG